MSDEPKPISPDDWISHHLARQQGDGAQYGELLALGGDAMDVKDDPAYKEWLTEKMGAQEDLPAERVPETERSLDADVWPVGNAPADGYVD